MAGPSGKASTHTPVRARPESEDIMTEPKSKETLKAATDRLIASLQDFSLLLADTLPEDTGTTLEGQLTEEPQAVFHSIREALVAILNGKCGVKIQPRGLPPSLGSIFQFSLITFPDDKEPPKDGERG
jgi:hypothetical protein